MQRRVVAWGSNSHGQLGNDPGIYAYSIVPIEVQGLPDVQAIAASGLGDNSGAFSLALAADGTVWAWGLLKRDIGYINYGYTPVQVPGLSNIIAIAAGHAHALALRADGTVWAWGSNVFSQLGNGTYDDGVDTPIQVPGLTDVVAIAAGKGHSLAIRSDGTVWAWGSNDYGECGIGSTSIRVMSPVQVLGLSNIVDVAAGSQHSLAVTADGQLYAWGCNAQYQLGDGTGEDKLVPTLVSTIADLSKVATYDNTSLALKKDGTVWVWGTDGLGYELPQFASPRQITELMNIVRISAGDVHYLAICARNVLCSWGYK